MKRFLSFVKKEFYHIFRDGRTLTILFGMPIIQIILFGFSITNEIRNADIAILDKSKDSATRQITDKLLASGYFRLSSILHSEAQIEEAFKKGDIKLVIIFEHNFQKKLLKNGSSNLQLIADATDPNTASTLTSYVRAIVQDYQLSQMQNKAGIIQVQPDLRMLYNPELEGTYMFVPGLITVILLLIGAMMTSITIAREKESGTMELLLVSPLRPAVIILGKSIPYIVLALINAATILIIGATIFGMPLEGNLGLLIAEIFLYIVLSLSLGILISTIAETQQTALLFSLMGLMLPTIILSGFIFPIESMPIPLQWISNIIPAKWFIIIIRNVMLKGTGLASVIFETAVLTGMTLFLLALSILKFNVRLSQS
ncbi:ABC transporter permease [Catalinimonas sp. 4WD22]|uniref:ABC transporter permease n=1 Tax=Catalinimonas locisalis TaxID=3133978 RepID=UPI0031015A3F